jgi:AAA ATPase domain
MPSRDDHSSQTTEAGGGSPHEPLIDRQLGLDLLRQHIARVAETGTGHAVLILGESGVGKSRLAAEAAAEARKRGMTVISVRCLGGAAASARGVIATRANRIRRAAAGPPSPGPGAGPCSCCCPPRWRSPRREAA